jgi:type III secretory pathway component EscV
MYRWNQWYDGLPEAWRGQAIVLPLLVIGTINMALTIWIGFPFALLLVLAVAAFATVRVPYKLGWLKPETEGADAPVRMEIEGWDWVRQANIWYDSQSDLGRKVVLLGILLGAGFINMLLTFSAGFPFGLLFLLAILALVCIRVPYRSGWLKAPEGADNTEAGTSAA